MEEAGELDLDFESGDTGHATSGVIDLDLGVESGQVAVPEATAEIDFDMSEESFDPDASMTSEMPGFEVDSPTVDESLTDDTSEMPVAGDSDSPTIEQQFASLDETGAMPSISELGSDDATEITNLDDLDEADDFRASDATAEIDLDDLGLDLEGLEASRIAAPEDGISDFDDTAESPTINEELDAGSELPDVDDLTDKNLALPDEDTDVGIGIDTSLLDATGQTQILSEDAAVDTASDVGASLSDDDQTMLADVADEDADTLVSPLGEDESTVLTSDINFDDLGGTGALPKDAFTGTTSMDDTGEMPSLAGSTDLDLDLDDLTAALKISKVGTAAEARNDETAEMPVGQDDADPTLAAPGDVSGDVDDARTMTEVGTKLDLARAYVDMGDPSGARSILEEVLEEGDEAQRQQAQQILDTIPS
jgi:pilus assembly protein FimV